MPAGQRFPHRPAGKVSGAAGRPACSKPAGGRRRGRREGAFATLSAGVVIPVVQGPVGPATTRLQGEEERRPKDGVPFRAWHPPSWADAALGACASLKPRLAISEVPGAFGHRCDPRHRPACPDRFIRVAAAKEHAARQGEDGLPVRPHCPALRVAFVRLFAGLTEGPGRDLTGPPGRCQRAPARTRGTGRPVLQQGGP